MPGWHIVTPAQMGIVTFNHPDADHDRLHDAMLREGFALATSTMLKGRKVLRLCTINPRTTEEDIIRTLDHLNTLVSGVY